MANSKSNVIAALVVLPLAFLSLASLAEDPPYIGYVYPAGGGQGSSFEVTVGGERIYDCQGGSVSGKGVSVELISSVASEAEKKKNANKKGAISQTVKLKVTIDKDAELGARDFRVNTESGISNKLNFQIGQLLESKEIEPNNKADQLQKKETPPNPKKPEPPKQEVLQLPTAVNGQIMPGDIDLFKFSAKKGQSLVLEGEARSLIPYIADAVPSWLQLNLSVLDSKGRELANSSDFRFEQDPVLFFDVPADGDYFVAVRDNIYRGREDFVYRVKVGELPFITHISPIGALRGSGPFKVKLYGKNLPSDTMDVAVPKDSPQIIHLTSSKNGIISNRVPFAAGDLPEVAEASGNNSQEKAQRVNLPVTVNSKISSPGEKDYYSFEGKKGQTVYAEILARRLGSPLDSGITLYNAKGERLKENDDQKDLTEGLLTHHADSFISHTLPEDGIYTIRVRDIQTQGGNEFAYRLNMSLPRPDFALRAEPVNVSVPKGGATSVSILAIRKNGFNGPINLYLKDKPRGIFLSGSLIPEGRDRIMVTISASEDAEFGLNNPLIEGRATINNVTVSHLAVPADNLMQAFIYRHSVPGEEQSLFVTQENPFALVVKIPSEKEILELPVGKEISFPIEVVRKPGKEYPVKLDLVNPPNGITLRGGWIAADKTSCKAVIRTEAKVAPNFKANLIIIGTAQIEKEEKVIEEPPKPETKIAAASPAAAPASPGKTDAKSDKPDAKPEEKPAPAPMPPAAVPPKPETAKPEIKSEPVTVAADQKTIEKTLTNPDKTQEKSAEKTVAEKDSKNTQGKTENKDNNKPAGDVKEVKRVKKEKFTVTAEAIPFVTIPEPQKKKPDENKDNKK